MEFIFNISYSFFTSRYLINLSYRLYQRLLFRFILFYIGCQLNFCILNIMFNRNVMFLFHIHILFEIFKDFQQRWLNMKRSYVDFTFTETVKEVQSDFVTSCSNLCLTRPFCVAVIFTKSTSAGIITMIETDSTFYEVQFERSDRKICKSSNVIQHFSSITTNVN